MSLLPSASGAPAEPTPEDEPPAATPAIDSPAPIADSAPVDEDALRALAQQADLRLFVGANADIFVTVAHAVATRIPGRNAICWPGLLFPAAWFLYRKMFGYAAITVLAPALCTLLHVPYGVKIWIAFGFCLLGGFGKRLYLAKARRMIAEIRAEAPDEDSARETIARAGGVSLAGAIFGVPLVAAFVSFAFLIP